MAAVAPDSAEFSALVAKALAARDSFSEQRRLYDHIQAHKVRAPELVVQAVQTLLKHKAKLKEDEYWELHEALFLAALDSNQEKVADSTLTVLIKRFTSESTRVMRLEGMFAEYDGKVQEALETYDEILKKDPVNSFAMKRKACIRRSQGELVDAITALNTYLKYYPADEHAWMELLELYNALVKHDLAIFCCEELLLLGPHNYVYNLLYAEALYASGKRDNIATARQYFAQSVELNPENNLRALYGLLLCLRARPAAGNLQPKLATFTTDRILTIYRTHAPKLLPLVEAALALK